MTDPSHPHRPQFRWWALALLLAFSLPVLWVVFIADGWTVNRIVVHVWNLARRSGLPLTPEHVDGVLNTVLMLPAALLGALWAPRVRWWGWGLMGLLASLGIETLQHLYLHRDASFYDVLFSTLGAFLGAWLGELRKRRLAARTHGC